MNNSNTFNILHHQFYINENNNELYIITGSRDIKFYDYLEDIINEKDLSEIEEYIRNMKTQLIELLPDIKKNIFCIINQLTIFLKIIHTIYYFEMLV